MVPERQTILDFGAARDVRGDGNDNQNSENSKAPAGSTHQHTDIQVLPTQPRLISEEAVTQENHIILTANKSCDK